MRWHSTCHDPEQGGASEREDTAMRRIFASLTVLAGMAFATPLAFGDTRLQGFGGVTFRDSARDTLAGGQLSLGLGSHVELFGELGHMRDTLDRNLVLDVLDLAEPFTGVGVRLSGLYGDGGLRLLTSPAPIRVYVEGSAGMARLSPRIDIGSDRFDVLEPFVNSALDRIHWNGPVVGGGGGIMLQPGPLTIDLGYRHKRILLDNPISVNQLRAAIGLRF
jgi:hypothetical protein